VARRITVAPVAADLLFDLELQRHLDHPTGALPDQLIQRPVEGVMYRAAPVKSPAAKVARNSASTDTQLSL
jgi:hypothetical protein